MPATKLKPNQWEKFRIVLVEILESRGQNAQHLATDLGKIYNQVYQWVRGAHPPNSENGFAILSWALARATAEEKKKIAEAIQS